MKNSIILFFAIVIQMASAQSGISIPPGNTVSISTLAETPSITLVSASATDYIPNYECEKGDMSPNTIQTGGIFLDRSTPCRFRDTNLAPLYAGFDAIHCYYESAYETGWEGSPVRTTGWAISSSTSFFDSVFRNMPGDTVMVSGAGYVRYMPDLPNDIKQGVYSVGWDKDMSLPLCGCLRRITIDTSRLPIGAISITNETKLLYLNEGDVIWKDGTVEIIGSSSATVAANDNLVTIQAIEKTPDSNEDPDIFRTYHQRKILGHNDFERQSGWEWIWVRGNRVLIDEDDFFYDRKYAKIGAYPSGEECIVIEIDVSMFGKNTLNGETDGLFTIKEAGGSLLVYARTKRYGYSAKIPISYLDRAINFCVSALKKEK